MIKAQDIGKLIENNSYVGRGIAVGKTPNAKSAVCAYFIMGRSENSRNRVFTVKNGEVFTEPFDESKVEDPSLIIYAAVRKFEQTATRLIQFMTVLKAASTAQDTLFSAVSLSLTVPTLLRESALC